MEKPSFNIPVMRHFDNIDDLLKFGRDGDLIPGQEKIAEPIAGKILEETRREDKSAIMFVCSSKKRGVQTAELIADEVKKVDDKMKIRIIGENSLTAIYQGEFILPPDYKVGEPFEGLALANKAFEKEVFGSPNGNFLYKFGDPVLQQDGSYKYPELIPYFKSYGESNRDLLIRVYELVIETSKKFDKLNSKTKIVVITHAQFYQVFRDLSTVSKMIKNNGFKLKTGELPKLCWELYSERFKKEKPTYEVNYIPIENLCDPEIVELLKKEVEYLKNLK